MPPLEGRGAELRQTILLAAWPSAEATALFQRHCSCAAGKARLKHSPEVQPCSSLMVYEPNMKADGIPGGKRVRASDHHAGGLAFSRGKCAAMLVAFSLTLQLHRPLPCMHVQGRGLVLMLQAVAGQSQSLSLNAFAGSSTSGQACSAAGVPVPAMHSMKRAAQATVTIHCHERPQTES